MARPVKTGRAFFAFLILDVMSTTIPKCVVILAIEDHLIADTARALPQVSGYDLMPARKIDNPLGIVRP